MKRNNSFSFYDSTINVCTTKADDWDTYNVIRKLMRRGGFTFHQDPHIKKRYPSLAKSHFAGQRRDVHFISRIYPAGFQVEFYEDVIRDNKNGGRHHFNKMKKMPYLRCLRVKKTHTMIAAELEILGFLDATKPDPSDAMEKMRVRRKELEDFQGSDFYRRPIPNYNSKDADGRRLQDGDVRFFRSYGGHLMRGVAYHNINNMWWVVVNHSEIFNLGSHNLFTYDRAIHKRKAAPDPLRSMQKRLAYYVQRQDFEKAIGLRDAIKKHT